MCCISASVVWFWKCTTITTTGKLVVVWRYDSPANSRHELLLIIPICYNMHFSGEPRDNQSVLDHSVPGDLSLSDSRHRLHWEPPQVEPRSRPPTSSPPIDLSNHVLFFVFFLGANKEILIAGSEGKQPPGQDQGTSPKGTGGSYTYVLLFWRKSRNGWEVMNKVDRVFNLSRKHIQDRKWARSQQLWFEFLLWHSFWGQTVKCADKGLHYLYGMYSCVPNVCRWDTSNARLQEFCDLILFFFPFLLITYFTQSASVAWVRRWMPTIPLTEPNFRRLQCSRLIKMREDLWEWKLSHCLMYITCYLYAVGRLFASRFSWQSLCVLFCMPGVYAENQN